MTAHATLVIGPSWVGDMVMAQSLFMRLKEQAPDTDIDVLAPNWTFPLLERMPQVRKALPMPLGHGQLQIGLRRQIGRSLRGHYQRIIVLPNSWKSGLIPFFARAEQRTGFVGEMRYGLLNDTRKLDKQALPKTVLRFLHLADPVGSPPPTQIPTPHLQVDETAVAAALAANNLDPNEAPILALCPGAEYGPAKRWPEAHYAEVARQYMEQGGQVWLFGSTKDRPVSAEISRLAPGCHDLAGQTKLGEAIDLMSRASAVISNDSGLMHVAAALDRPLVALYGSSDPGFTPPLNERHRIVRLGLECSPCFKRDCPLGHTDCLNKISPQSVVEALATL